MSYMLQRQMIEEANYRNDPRVRALEDREHQPDFDEARMILHFDPPECEVPGCCHEPYGYTWEVGGAIMYGHTLDGCLEQRHSYEGYHYVHQRIWPMREVLGADLATYYLMGPDGGMGPLGHGTRRAGMDAVEQMAEYLNKMSGYAGPNGHPRIAIPAVFQVCGTCGGKGSHVNPSIDAGGISFDGDDQWDRDEDFQEHYFSGMYDQSCNECDGRRVVPAPGWDDNDPAHVELREHLDDEARGRADDWAERESERRMGA